MEAPRKGDWWGDVTKDLKDLDINLKPKEISNMSKNEWKNVVNQKAKMFSFEKLTSKVEGFKIGKNNKYEEPALRNYLKGVSRLTPEVMKTILGLRTESLKLPKYVSYKFQNDKSCRFECKSEEDVAHTIECKNDNVKNKKISADDLNEVLNDVVNTHTKVVIKELKRIWDEREARLAYK